MPHLDELRRLATAIPAGEGDERRMAEGQLASTESEHRLRNLDPGWIDPLLAFRDTLPPSVDGLHGRSMRRKVRYAAVLSGLTAGVAMGILSIRP